jgi:hypothetical protein
MKWAAGVSLFAAVLAVGTTLPERRASAQVQAVPRAGMAFNDTVTQRVTIESVDPEDRTVAFLLSDGQLVAVPVADGVGNLAAIQDGSMANVTYNQIVTILNLRQKGPGSKEERRESMKPASANDRVRPLHGHGCRRRPCQQHRLGDRRHRRRRPHL